MIDIPNLEIVDIKYKDMRTNQMICFPELQSKHVESSLFPFFSLIHCRCGFDLSG